ncbi:MAG: protein kinase [Polyangiaceae bacterium]
MVEVDDSAPLHEGVLVGKRFRLERLLGRGAVGSVWLATHIALSSSVAIKFLDRTKVLDPDEMDIRLDRFRFEAQISARLAGRTNHTVAVHDAGIHRDIPYLVMEYAPGRTLDDVVGEQGPVEPALLIDVLEQIAEALDSAHALGIIHRDVKLANILAVEREDRKTTYKLADFGVARMSGHKELDLLGPRKTADGLIVGTPAYMSPEQIGGLESYGPSVDLWALGVVLYEALTGQLPFNSVSLTELAMEISGRPHKPPSLVRPDLGTSLDAFFERALAKRPGDRYSTAAEMCAAFAASLEAQSGEHSLAHETPVTPKKRRLGWAHFAIGAGVMGCVAAGITLLGTPPKTTSAAGSAVPAAPSVDTAVVALPSVTAPPAVSAEPSVVPSVAPSSSFKPRVQPPIVASATSAPVRTPPTHARPQGSFDPSSVQ